ncbi:chaplin [Streptantibioticus rubrisoli]|uniref:Chaplin n=1 Tax=Streptantibioticus rubrisoli TaxID=1387313 RepID=A0ABT1PA53_9ACTN|nr:chaplin [Streptantibioticus rubrisoli]MCQ4041128.1 chaplin [Streptantibioticus rubrisoli]
MRVRSVALAATLALTGALATATTAVAQSGANGSAVGSPGVISGDVIQVPVNLPIQVCGNSIDIIGILNPAAGNTCQSS